MGKKDAVRNGILEDPPRYVKSLKCVWSEHSPEEILPLITDDEGVRLKVGELDGQTYSVKLFTIRLQNFRRSLVCASCGRVGVSFRAEHSRGDARSCTNPHLNLYAADGELMTHDHIVPLSKGGARDSMDNTQTMCARCNCEKGSKIS